jgi:hypothetical protein
MTADSSSAGESHPHALTDPYVNLSVHTAPANLSPEVSRSQAGPEGPTLIFCTVAHTSFKFKVRSWLTIRYKRAWPVEPATPTG